MAAETDELPKLYQNCTILYDAMEQQATVHDNGLLMWVGFLTQLVDELGFGIPRYSRIVGMLSDMGCIEQIKRGGGPTESEWVVHQKPTLERYKWAKGERKKEEVNSPEPLEQQLADLRQIINNQDSRLDYLENLVDILCEKLGI